MFSKLNDAYDSVKNGLEIEVKLATAEQRELLANAKMSLADLKILMAELKEENETLKDQLTLSTQVKPGVDCYVRLQSNGAEYAICSKCWEVDKLAVTLVHSSGYYPECPKCKNNFPDVPMDKGYVNIKR